MSATASATLLILSLSTVRRTIADTIDTSWTSVEVTGNRFPAPYPQTVFVIRPNVNLREHRSYRFALRPIEWFYLTIGDRNFARLENSKKRRKTRRQSFEH